MMYKSPASASPLCPQGTRRRSELPIESPSSHQSHQYKDCWIHSDQERGCGAIWSLVVKMPLCSAWHGVSAPILCHEQQSAEGVCCTQQLSNNMRCNIARVPDLQRAAACKQHACLNTTVALFWGWPGWCQVRAALVAVGHCSLWLRYCLPLWQWVLSCSNLGPAGTRAATVLGC